MSEVLLRVSICSGAQKIDFRFRFSRIHKVRPYLENATWHKVVLQLLFTASKQRCTFSSTTFSSVQFSTRMLSSSWLTLFKSLLFKYPSLSAPCST